MIYNPYLLATELLDYNGMTPPSPLSMGRRVSRYYRLATGLQAYNGIAKSEVRITFFKVH